MTKSMHSTVDEDDEVLDSGTQIWNSLSTQNVATTTTVALIGAYLVYKLWGGKQ